MLVVVPAPGLISTSTSIMLFPLVLEAHAVFNPFFHTKVPPLSPFGPVNWSPLLEFPPEIIWTLDAAAFVDVVGVVPLVDST